MYVWIPRIFLKTARFNRRPSPLLLSGEPNALPWYNGCLVTMNRQLIKSGWREATPILGMITYLCDMGSGFRTRSVMFCRQLFRPRNVCACPIWRLCLLSFNLLIGWQLSIWNCCKPQLLCFWRLALNVVVEVFPRPFSRVLLLQGCLLKTRYLDALTNILSVFAKLQKATIIFAILACSHETTRLSMDGFSFKLVFEGFSKIPRRKSSCIKSWQE